MSRDSRRLLPEPLPFFSLTKRFAGWLAVLAALYLLNAAISAGSVSDSSQGISQAAADACSAKVKKMEDFAANAVPGKKQALRFSQDEVNSYLALELSAKYSPSLKSLMFTFGEAKLQGGAVVDFDRLGMRTARVLSKIVAAMFSGSHKLSARGKLIAQHGKANFQLEEARFDDTSLPNFLVEEIITAVGRRQRPPFDPMQPSQMPYRIEKVELHTGYIRIYQ
jgi:hypothetical protein